jgi:antitoxin VapB
MNLQIRDPRARTLAEELAERRQITMTEAVIVALEAELMRDKVQEMSALGVADLVDELRKLGNPGGRNLTKDEVDEMWGHE